jgi:hypothetical protein
MVTELRLIVAVAVLSAFVILDADRIAKWISRQLARLVVRRERVDAEYAPRLTALRVVQQAPVIRRQKG